MSNVKSNVLYYNVSEDWTINDTNEQRYDISEARFEHTCFRTQFGKGRVTSCRDMMRCNGLEAKNGKRLFAHTGKSIMDR